MSTLGAAAEFDRPALLPLAREYRRCGLYLVIGYLCLLAILIAFEIAGLGFGAERWSMALVLGFFCFGTAMLTYRQVLLVDHDGIWRRRFFRWDLWPWKAFAAGQVRKTLTRNSFLYPLKPWWNRYLHLDFLEAGDRDWLLERIEAVWNHPPEPEIPEEITIKHAFRCRLSLSRNGIRVGKGSDDGQVYDWSDVERVEITRLDHSRRDFHNLRLWLKGRTKPIQLYVHQGRELWSGADGETIVRALEMNLVPGRFEITALEGPPRSLEEVERRLALLDARDRQMRQLWWLAVVVEVGMLGVLFFGQLQIHRHNPLHWDFAKWCSALAMLFLISNPILIVWWWMRERNE